MAFDPAGEGPYILWVDYGTEGWQPWSRYQDPSELLNELQEHQIPDKWKLTREVQLRMEESAMKIERNEVSKMTMKEFCEANDLTVQVGERNARLKQIVGWKYYASIKGAEMKEREGDHFLRSVAGNGDTEEAAIADLAFYISEKILIFDTSGSRMKLPVPKLTAQ